MDGGPNRSWQWMVDHMPRVVSMLREERKAGRGSQVDDCWRRGVIGGEPGLFWASEGSVSIGTPPEQALVPAEVMALLKAFPGSAVLMLAGQIVGEQHGAQ